MNDVILITIDCWRHDTVDRMDNLTQLTSEYLHRDVICQSAATLGTFPAILAGNYYPFVYDTVGSVAEGVTSVLDVFRDAGYDVGAFVGSNPFLNTWSSGCDQFWNDGMNTAQNGSNVTRMRTKAENTLDYLRCKSSVTTSELARRARAWYESQEGPRFLWMHLMDVHAPFFPGFRSCLGEGILDTYRSHLALYRAESGLDRADKAVLRSLYQRCVDSLDRQIPEIFSFIDPSATVLVTGDHGEEFDHDGFGHSKLYDECVRVPLLVSEDIGDAFDTDHLLRQMDISPTLLTHLGMDIPSDWNGVPASLNERDPMMINHSPREERVYAGIRSEAFKLITVYDEHKTVLRKEAYDLTEDPAEQHDVYGETGELDAMEETLEEFVDGFRWGNVLEGSEHTPELDETVEERLRVLGYK